MSDIDPNKLKVADLREELKARGLDTKGTKPVLVKRLKKALNEEKGGANESISSSADDSQEASMLDDSSQEANESQEVQKTEEPEADPEPEAQQEPVEEEKVEPTEGEPEIEEKSAPVDEVKDDVKPEPEEVKQSDDTPVKSEEAAQESDVKKEEEAPQDDEMKEEVKEEEQEPKGNGDVAADDSDMVAVDVADDDGHEKRHGRKRSRSRSHERKHSRSRSRERRRSRSRERRRSPTPKKIEMEDEAWETSESVCLDRFNSDLTLAIDETNLAATPMTEGGFAMMWAGVRGSYGVKKGKVAFEVRLLENCDVHHLPADEVHQNVARVGWSCNSTSLQLGEEAKSFGYGGTAKAATECKFEDYGQVFGAGDVITSYVDFEMDENEVYISFAKNGDDLGICFPIEKSKLDGEALFPHILTKNISFDVNFGSWEEPYFPLKDDFVWIEKVPVEDRERGTAPPAKKEECEMMMMVGLPGAGKTTWSEKHKASNPDKMFYILGTNLIIDKMKVMGLPRKKNYAGRWDVLIDKATKCLNKLLETAASKKRNYILDQTNVYASARRRKMQPFEGFQRKAVVIVPSDEEFQKRVENREKEEGKEVPERAVLEMKANFTLPEEGPLFDSIEFVELAKEEATELIEKYNKEGKDNLPPPEKRSRWGGQDNRRDSRNDRRSNDGYDRRSGGWNQRDNRHGGGGGGGRYGGGGDRRGGGGGWGDRSGGGGNRWGGGGSGGGRDRYDRSGGGGNRWGGGGSGGGGSRWGGGGGGGRQGNDRRQGGGGGWNQGGRNDRRSGGGGGGSGRWSDNRSGGSGGGGKWSSGGSSGGGGGGNRSWGSGQTSQYGSQGSWGDQSGWGSQQNWGSQQGSWGNQGNWNNQNYQNWGYGTSGQSNNQQSWNQSYQQWPQQYTTNQQYQQWYGSYNQSSTQPQQSQQK